MDSQSLDRKTFLIGLVVAVVAILVGVYFLTQQSAPSNSVVAPAPRNREPPLAPSPYITDVQNDAEAVSELSRGPKVVLLHTPWCGHCRNMMPAFMEAAATGGGVKWVRVDGNVASSIVKREDVRGFPTVFGVDFSGAVKQMNGPRDAQSLLQFAASLRAPEPEAKTVETEAVKDETA